MHLLSGSVSVTTQRQGVPRKNRPKGARCVLAGKPPSGIGQSVLAVGSYLGPDVGGCPRRSGHSTAPSPLGALTFLDVNILSILPVMGSTTEGSACPCLRFPGWRAAEARVVLSMTLHLLGEPFNTVYSNSHKESMFFKPVYRLWGLKIRTRPEHKSIHHRVLCRCKNTEPNEKPPQCPQVGTNLSHYDSLTRKTAV